MIFFERLALRLDFPPSQLYQYVVFAINYRKTRVRHRHVIFGRLFIISHPKPTWYIPFVALIIIGVAVSNEKTGETYFGSFMPHDVGYSCGCATVFATIRDSIVTTRRGCRTIGGIYQESFQEEEK
jgi:hypothetical protein